MKKHVIWLWVIPGGFILLAILLFFMPSLRAQVGSTMSKLVPGNLTRAMKNNNPGNLRPSSGVKWIGQTGIDNKNFLIFETMLDGIRALCITALHYQTEHNITTLTDFGDRWAPPASIGGDNVGAAIGAYGASLGGTLDVDPNATFDLLSGQPFSVADLAHAIAVNESGAAIVDTVIAPSLFQDGATPAIAYVQKQQDGIA